jgi:hypothetical protein
MSNYTIYKDRLDALCALAERTANRYEQGDYFDRRLTIVELLRRLSDFASLHFKFFYDRLGQPEAGQPEPKLLSDPSYPPESAFFAIIAQTARDLEVITQAAAQRQLNDDLLARQLKRADELAYKAIQPALTTFLKRDDQAEPQTALVYFQKARSIRVIPYAPVALVGIPFASLGGDQDLYAIPHEIGHYVFWHGNRTKKGYKPLRDDVRKLKKENGHDFESWSAKWIEEIFADVYGCLIDPKGMATDFQGLSTEYAHRKFFKDDGQHPPPWIRPSVYYSVLGILGEKENNETLKDEAVRLKTVWRQIVAKRIVAPIEVDLKNEENVIALAVTDVPRSSTEIQAEEVKAKAVEDALAALEITEVEVKDVASAILKLLDFGAFPQQLSGWLSSSSPGELRQNTRGQYQQYIDLMNDNAIGEDEDSDNPTVKYPRIPDLNRKGSYQGRFWRRWVFANGWTDGPNGLHNP